MCYPIPSAENQIARDLSHREAHRTFREDFQSKSREPGLTRRRARSRLALEAISGFSKTRNLLYPRPPSGENIPKVVAQIAPGSEKRPLSDRVLAGSNLGCQRLLKKRFFAHAQPASRCGLDSHVARRTRAPSRSPVRWRGREKNRGKTGLALHRPNLKRVRGILVEFSSWDPPHRRKKVEQIIQKSAGLTRENCSRAPDRIFGPRPRRLRESSIPRAARPKSAHPRSRSQSPYPNEIDGA